uniref:Peptidoglycan glycosyltransferase n=1 Tax=Thermosporothrix sp. COM3 TaxID=2490863 RepID=A0A455SEK4_9CHLR|nr:peptidoglycan glycosyltransferase [Thermosporothrix sp. COM3]
MEIGRRVYHLSILIVVLFVIMSGTLVYWQVDVAGKVVSNPRNMRLCLETNVPLRGRIFDRNGVLLADMQPDARACGGVIRHYYEPSLAGLIGYYAGPNYPATGLEARYNDTLMGKQGQRYLDEQYKKLVHRRVVGNDLYLTIDVRIQRAVNKAFDTPLLEQDPDQVAATNRGAAIVTNPHTGQILAMLSRPAFDPNKLVKTLAHGDESYYRQLVAQVENPLLFRPLLGLYTPGSTYKTVTLSGALDTGTTTLDHVYDPEYTKGPVVLGQHLFHPQMSNILGYTVDFHISTNYGFAHSDNILFAKLGQDMGLDRWLEFNKRFFVGQSIPFELPVARSSVLKADGTLDENMLVDNAFGQGVDFITPLQMELFNSAIANGGQLMQPVVTLKMTRPDGEPLSIFAPKELGKRQMQQRTALDTQQAMYGVVRCGSGSLEATTLAHSPWGIIAKTSTGELGGDRLAHSWLITQAPYAIQHPEQAPTLTITAMRENGGEGGSAIGPMVSAMYQEIFSKGYVKVEQPAAPPATYCCDAKLLQLGCG